MTIFTFPGVQISTAGLATETEQQSQTALLTTIDADTGSISTSAASIDGKTPALGQALAAGSVPVVLTAAQVSTLTPQTDALTDIQLRASAVPVSAASLPLPTDAATQTTLAALNAKVTAVNTGAVVVSSSALPTGAATEATLASIDSKITAVNTGAVTISAALPAGTNTIGAVTQSGTWTVQAANTATSTLSNVSASASNVTLLSSNSSRKGATIFNDSSSALYVKFGTTSSTTSFTVKIAAGGYFEIPGPTVYTGILDGIWDSASGAARVTEIT